MIKIFLAGLLTTSLLADVNMVTDSSEVHVKPLIERFKKETGINVNVLYMKKGIVDRAGTGEFDFVMSNAVELDMMNDKHMFVKTVSRGVPTNGYYHVTSGRTRGFFVKNGVQSPVTYDDLLKTNKICSRKLTDEYYIEFFSTFIERYGSEYTKKYITALKTKLPEQYGNDRLQVKRVHEGECLLSIGNSYYYEIMKHDPEQSKWITDVQFHEPKDAVWLYRGVGVLKQTPDSIKFLNWVTSKPTLRYIEEVTYEKTNLPLKDVSEISRIKSHRNEAYQLLQD